MEKNKGMTVVAFLLGGVIGAGLALLFAPYSGVETRRRIKEGADDCAEWTKGKAREVKTKIEEGVGSVKQMKEDLHTAFDAGREAYNKSRERLVKESS